MIDLHSHLLPGIDDGAPDLATSIEMAKSWVDQGVRAVACTPHILPGVYHNTGPQIREAVAELQASLLESGVELQLVTGADNHIVPDFCGHLSRGHLLTLANSRYVLVEPPHHVAPLRLEETFFDLIVAGYVPILTHPERLTWIETKYEVMQTLVQRGVWMQVTSGSLRGAFGRRPQYWAERMLSEGLVHILATDAHNLGRRRPDLAEGRVVAEKHLGRDAAEELVVTRPQAVLMNKAPGDVSRPDALLPPKSRSENDSKQYVPPVGRRSLAQRLRGLFD